MSLFSLTSCGLEEPYTPEKNPDAVIEFVGRPVGFNNQDVDTKSEPNGEYDNKVCNCYFLLFDASTGGILYRTGGDAESLQNFRIPKTELGAKGITSVTACYLVNVPKTFAEGLKYLEKTSSAASGTNPGDNECLSTAVIDIPSYQSGTPMGVPVIDGKAGIPMYGQTTTPIDLSKYTTPYEIPVKRLFAKATVSLKMDLTNGGSGFQANSYMQMTSYAIYNLPQKVKLTEVTLEDGNYECAWVKTAGTGLSTTSSNKIYNQAATGIITDLPKELVFHCYVPEYYLLPKSSSTQGHGQEEYKPLMFDNTDNNRKYPVYIQLNGSYEPVSGVSQNLTYKIYLGENASTDFTLKRNTHYKNNLVIKGVENKADGTNGKIDHRVTITQGDVVSMYGEVANCYMIGKEGKYNFPAYKGAYKYAQLKDAPMCTSGIAKIIASDNNSIWLKDENITVTTDELTGEKIITINVTNGDDIANEDITIAASGNAILALLDDNGNIEWSWHLWFTGGLNWGLGNMEFFEMTTQEYPSGYNLMDRNLGVNPLVTESFTPGVVTGLYYKYGCKEPFFNGAYQGGGNITTTDGETITPTWTSTKSPTDPCPPGYKVPFEGAWGDGMSHSYSTIASFMYDTSIYYPYLGEPTYETKDIIATGYERTITKETNGKESPSGFKYPKTRTQTRTQTKIIDVEYSAPMVCYSGNVWTSMDHRTFYYDYNMVDFTNFRKMINDLSVNRYKETSRSVTVTQTKSNIISSWKDDKSPTESDWSPWSEPRPVEYSYSFGDTWPLEMLYKELEKEDAGIYYSNSTYASQSNDQSKFPIRCIKEE